MALTLNQVTKYYEKQKAIDNLSFTLNPGEICGFLGPNGAGKSTTMKIITGYLSQYSGSVKVNDIHIRQNPLKAKELIGYLPEHNPLYPDMYVREYLEHVARLYHVRPVRQKVEEMIALTGLSFEAKKKIGQLSKGYRQRVGLAQAMIHEPEVLILDEPMTGLDPNQLEEIRNLIKTNGKNKIVLFSTHIMQEVEAICDRVIIINQGKIVADQSLQSMQSSVNSQMHIHMRFAPGCDSSWLTKTTLFQKLNQYDKECWKGITTIHQDPRIELFNLAAIHQCPLIELKVESYHLEDIFRELTLHNNENSSKSIDDC